MAKQGGKKKAVEPKGDQTKTEMQEKMRLNKPVPVSVKTVAPVMRGLSVNDAINIQDESDIPLAISRQLEKMFAVKKDPNDVVMLEDGDYFVKSEQILQSMDRKKKYKVVFVEDHKGVNWQIFFLIPQARIA